VVIVGLLGVNAVGASGGIPNEKVLAHYLRTVSYRLDPQPEMEKN
jgi:hypothetical protein